MSDTVLDDPGELIRFWLWFQKHHSVRGVNLANLARAVHTKPATVGAWLTRHAIPSFYWNPIARFFGFETYRAIEDQARELWSTARNRRGYAPLERLKVKRRARTKITTPGAGGRVHPVTPIAAAAIADSIDGAKKSRPRLPTASQARGRKTHGTRRDV